MGALHTDLYQITMAAAYFSLGKADMRAAFEYFVRDMPKSRSFLLFCGLEQALEYLENLKFTDDQIEYLRELQVFRHVSAEFFDYLREFRFTGDVWAMPEGTVFFAPEPALWVEAPIIEAQIVETALLSILNFQTLVASKAARVVIAAGGRPVAEFGTRRAHGAEAAVMAARAAYVAGCPATSNVEAGKRFGIPVVGTMAHSFVMSFDSEREAFKGYLDVFPESAIFLIDTYDTIAAAKLAAEFGEQVVGVRLDSGDIAALAKDVRRILDEAGMRGTKIMASGDLNEYKIDELIKSGAPVDSFGVGTEMATSRDDPSLGGIYKLVEVLEGGRWIPKRKASQNKATLPYRKQVYRIYRDGIADHDYICPHAEEHEGEPLLVKVMDRGRAIYRRTLEDARKRASEQVDALPEPLKDIWKTARYPIRLSPRLEHVDQS
ncbi:MAG TPA: nicotinate phosphoribosyltransferase [Proteobacteria bacterium]|nr:nicotinate phosphoribosyltransferase [Pseudomonadota bacterium]